MMATYSVTVRGAAPSSPELAQHKDRNALEPVAKHPEQPKIIPHPGLLREEKGYPRALQEKGTG
jgi:hypothetical protein